jgi:LacI family transcriptional regulator
MREIHSSFPETTAVVCNSDVLAFGAIAECRRLGLRVPGDITITGFDDQDMAALTDPPLTTVAVPALEMGIRSAEALLHAVGGKARIGSARLDTNLIIRASSGPPRQAATLATKYEIDYSTDRSRATRRRPPATRRAE